MAYHPSVEALAEDVQHRSVFTQHLSDEMRDPALLGDDRQALDENRAEAMTVEAIGDLDRHFRAGRRQDYEESMPDDHPCLVVYNEPTAVGAGLRRPVRGLGRVHRAAEEPQPAGFLAQAAQE